jgi:hypothetical protein
LKRNSILLFFLIVIGAISMPCALINGNIPGCLKTARTADLTYSELALRELGLEKNVFDVAISGYESLLTGSVLCNPGIIAIADLSQPSTSKRLYIIDLVKNKLLFNTWVAHGKNTGSNIATGFSNHPGSLQSSIGFYLTGERYNGQHGVSLRLHGMEPGYNDKAFDRAIVVHGADYVNEQIIRQTGRLGRSFGCPAVASNLAEPIINTLGNGALFLVYYPDKNYLSHSKLATASAN